MESNINIHLTYYVLCFFQLLLEVGVKQFFKVVTLIIHNIDLCIMLFPTFVGSSNLIINQMISGNYQLINLRTYVRMCTAHEVVSSSGIIISLSLDGDSYV